MDDLISRQAAVDAIDDWWITVDDNRHPVDVIKALPSAQAEWNNHIVVRCGECKWWHEIDSVEGTTFGECMRPHPINQEGWFCADGERKEK